MYLTIEEIAWCVANGHAYDLHVEQEREFKNPEYGPVLQITTREEFWAHIVTVLESNGTQCFTGFKDEPWRMADFFYHEPTNTLVIVPADPTHEPTAYRPVEGKSAFLEKLKDAQSPDNLVVPLAHSIYELRPELARQKNPEQPNAGEEKDNELRKLQDTLDQRFRKERQEMVDRHAAQTAELGEMSSEHPRRSALQKQHEQELRDLKTRQDQERKRHLREHNRAREIVAELERSLEQKRLTEEFGRGKGRRR